MRLPARWVASVVLGGLPTTGRNDRVNKTAATMITTALMPPMISGSASRRFGRPGPGTGPPGGGPTGGEVQFAWASSCRARLASPSTSAARRSSAATSASAASSAAHCRDAASVRIWACSRAIRSGARAAITLSIAEISRAVSAANVSWEILSACRLDRSAKAGGSSDRVGICAPSTSTGMIMIRRCSAAPISVATQSIGSSSRRWPRESRAPSQPLPITATSTSLSPTAEAMTAVKSIPGCMASTSMKSWKRSSSRSAIRAAACLLSSRR